MGQTPSSLTMLEGDRGIDCTPCVWQGQAEVLWPKSLIARKTLSWAVPINVSGSAIVVPYRDTPEARQVSLWKRWLFFSSFFVFWNIKFLMWSMMLASKKFMGESQPQHPVWLTRGISGDLWGFHFSHEEILCLCKTGLQWNLDDVVDSWEWISRVKFVWGLPPLLELVGG